MGAACSPDQYLSCTDDILPLMDHIRGKRAVILGLGLFGGGEGAARFLANRGAEVLVTDQKQASRLAPALDRLKKLPINYRLGENRESDLLGADLVVVNPAVPRTNPMLCSCRDRGIPLTSPMNLFLSLCPATVAAVTGSAGKSTTTVMLGNILRTGRRRVYIGGNMGISLLPDLGEISEDDLVVLELSSVQLEDAAHLPWSPHLAVVTNITPNHLDRYGTFEAYAAAKKNIIRHQTPADAVVLNAQNQTLMKWAGESPSAHTLYFDVEGELAAERPGTMLRGGRLMWQVDGSQQVICSAERVPLPGRHNVANALAAAAAARWVGIPAQDIRSALTRCDGLEHRLEECATVDGITFYNDSDSTTPESAIAGLKSFSTPITLIAGGYNKDLDLSRLYDTIVQEAEVLITLGTSGPDIAQGTREAALRLGHEPVIREAQTLEKAIHIAHDLSMPGSTVLFSPACASFDMFENFAQRGRRFKELVQRLARDDEQRPAECA